MRGQGIADTALPPLEANRGDLRRVLLVRLDNTGDVVLLSPAVAALRDALPEAALTLLTSPAGARSAGLLPALDEVIEHRASWQQLKSGSVDADEERALIERLRAEAFDVAIVFTSFAQDTVAPSYLCYLAGIPVRAAYASERFSGEVITHPVPHEGAPSHQAERNIHLVQSLGVRVADSSLQLSIPDAVRAQASALLQAAGIEDGAPFVAVVPGASARARRYAHDRFAVVAREMAGRDLPVVVLGSPNEETLAGEVEAEAGAFEVMSFAGRTSIPLVAAVIARASLVVANNSLALHLADALSVPVVSTYAGTDPQDYWRPRHTPHRLLTNAVPCAPCFRIECDRRHECLDIEPREVLAAAEALLSPVGRTDAAAGTGRTTP